MVTQIHSKTTLPPIDYADKSELLLSHYKQYLRARGHKSGTVHAYVESIRHFLNWLDLRPHDQRTIGVDSAYQFAHVHLPSCRCHQPARCHLNAVRAALNHLLHMLGKGKLCGPVDPVAPAIEDSLRRFDAYLDEVCGLASITRHARCRFVSLFLVETFHDQPLVYECIDACHLINFITDQSRNYQPLTLGVLSCALRSYLRFLQYSGAKPSLLGTDLPSPANWRLATLPSSMSEGECARFWSAFDRSSAIGKRDYAMARCLADLALRCHEVAALSLDDIDWRAGVLQIKRTKTRRADRMPLPGTTAQALIDYLKLGRPPTGSRAVFVYHRAPFGEGVQKTTVRGAVRRAFGRAQLAYNGTHILRRTAATMMVQNGIPIKTVADVLRHRSINTTMIYAKVDLSQLSTVTMPWPELPS
jgi:integrase